MDIAAHERYIDKLAQSVYLENMTDKEKWHFERRLGIGGSDVAAILGMSPYKTAHHVWLEKTGRIEPEDLSRNEKVHFGNVLEDVVAQEYTRRTKNKVQRHHQPYVHDQQPWLRANVDRIVVGKRRLLECKTASAFTAKNNWGPSGSDQVPESYLLQVTHYMNVVGYDRADLAVLIGGNEFRIYHFKLNHDLNELVNQHLRDFWFHHVVADIPPEPTTLPELNAFYPQDNGQALEATPEIVAALEERQKALAVKKEAEAIAKEQEVTIKQFMGANQILMNSGKKLASWTSRQSSHFDTTRFKQAHPDLTKVFTKTQESRIFRA